MVTSLLSSLTVITSGVLAVTFEKMSTWLLHNMNMSGEALVWVYTLTDEGGMYRSMFLTSKSTTLSCLEIYIPLYTWQPFRICNSDSMFGMLVQAMRRKCVRIPQGEVESGGKNL